LGTAVCSGFSFVSNTSFAAFPSLGGRPLVRLSFDLKSRASSGIVLFNSGGPLYTDFVAVELVDGRATLRVNKGTDYVTVTSEAPVDDGEWHRVRTVVVLAAFPTRLAAWRSGYSGVRQ